MSEIILFPEIDALQKEIERLRTELSMLMTERDELRFVICKNIEMKYMLLLGGLEHKAFSLQCKYLRLKRKAEMIQARLNRREPVDLEEIDEELDIEFASYQEKLDEQIQKMKEAAIRSSSERLTEAETKELKKRYHRIVKALHPDLNPDVTEAQIELFHQAVMAYENGDLLTLRMIDDMVIQEELPAKTQDPALVLQTKRDQLQELAKIVRDQINEIKVSFPYTEKDLVDDKEKIAERRENLQTLIDDYNTAIKAMQEHIKNLMR